MAALKYYAHLLVSLAVTVLIGGFLTAALVRFSPGFGVDEHELDPTRDVAALRARQAVRPEQDGFLAYSVRHTAAMFGGDLGVSRNWNRPVADLLRERWPVTAQLMGVGILGGWALAPGLRLARSDLPQPVLEKSEVGIRQDRVAGAVILSSVFRLYLGMPYAVAVIGAGVFGALSGLRNYPERLRGRCAGRGGSGASGMLTPGPSPARFQKASSTSRFI